MLQIRFFLKYIFDFTENPEDILPYATFVLPEVSCGNENDALQDYAAPKDARQSNNFIQARQGNTELQVAHPENMGTISNFDMLILHENSTLPLSDAYSKSVSKIINAKDFLNFSSIKTLGIYIKRA